MNSTFSKSRLRKQRYDYCQFLYPPSFSSQKHLVRVCVCTADDVISCFPLSCGVPIRLQTHTHTAEGSSSKQQ